ncbi:hypothetical protein EK904_012317 [Melospiza melodia maxima]|nr:hypothetical protein EK904_012317 [Melospiza melodia maxima]
MVASHVKQHLLQDVAFASPGAQSALVGELNSFPGGQCCSQARSLHGLLSLRAAVRPRPAEEQ